MDKIALGALRIGLENSYWYSDYDEKVFNELVRKAKAFDAIEEIYADRTTTRIAKYFRAVEVINKFYDDKEDK